MNLQNLLNTKSLQKLQKEFEEQGNLTISGFSNVSSKIFITDFFMKKNRGENFFWIVNSKDELLETEKNLKVFLGDDVEIIVGNKGLSEGEKNFFVSEMFKDDKRTKIFVFEKSFLFESFSPFENLKKDGFLLKEGEKFDEYKFLEFLNSADYKMSSEAKILKGEFRKIGNLIEVFPINSENVLKVFFDGEKISEIEKIFSDIGKKSEKLEKFLILQNKFSATKKTFLDIFQTNGTVIFDELFLETGEEIAKLGKLRFNKYLDFNLFPDDDKKFHHLRYLSVLKFYNEADFVLDLNEKIKNGWDIVLGTKRFDELKSILDENKLNFVKISPEKMRRGASECKIQVVEIPKDGFLPSGFQNPDDKTLFLSEKEIFTIQKSKRNQSIKKMSLDFITSLKEGDYVVHFDHGIGLFEGIISQNIDGIRREYLAISYQLGDKIFVPIDQIDKVSKYLSDEGVIPKISKLGSNSWKVLQKKVKDETNKIAKELLSIYAKRKKARRESFLEDTELQKKFEKTFPYEETPGQMQAIGDVKKDMEGEIPMDRLVVGDVGFGKTEVAMRAAFKATESGKQVAVIAPVTILAVQHFEGFKKRMAEFGKKIAAMTRFQSQKEQKDVLKKLENGEIDIVIGTHRLFSDDVKFKNLGLLIIDEEQKFGVKQKEKIKKMKADIDILTMTATPIPRTLNMGLNKLRDISTITTPPQGRLPVISELRKYSDAITRDAILKEIKRGGQVYFLHNRVETIEGIADKLSKLVPEAKFIVAHGQLSPHELEERILAYKKGEYDVLISSTIIENGIDLSNANTMIVNNAEKFGLSQLYQLRGRIGRSKRQAFAYFLYHTRGVSVDAKKRLRAIVEASELGAGFQIAMKDLEIRGAGDILGAKQSGSATSIGVSHFLRVLEKAVEEMRSGGNLQKNGEENFDSTTIDLPINGFIPDGYITEINEKMSIYQKLSATTNEKLLSEIVSDIEEEYGEAPIELKNLEKLLRLKIKATKAQIKKIFTRGGENGKELVFLLLEDTKPEKIFKLFSVNQKWQIRGDSVAILMDDLAGAWFLEVERSVEVLI
ncbi:transcription-repair coupling factor [Candidatus Gracilibacteria bacterium]|nr:transcription-repair coupling factor [Candidatus Gracilibacteria bacterium]